MSTSRDAADPRAQWRTLPTSVPPEEMTTGQAVEPLPEAVLDDKWQSDWRRAVEAGG